MSDGASLTPYPRHRFFVAVPLVTNTVVAVDELAPQLAAVLRFAAGDRITLLDNAGSEYLCELTTLTRSKAAVRVLEGRACAAEPAVELSLFQCSLKQDKFEWVLQKGTELGVRRFVPVISARSIVRPAEALLKKYARWQVIVREAAEQCGRGRLPEIAPPLEWDQAIRVRAGVGLLPWEEASGSVRLSEALASQADAQAVSLLIGPEGGLTADEVAAAQGQGWQVVSLGPRILRAETAAIAALAVIGQRM